ncbi:MAG: hypothetical protein WCL47_05495 [Holophagaceae bacterium]
MSHAPFTLQGRGSEYPEALAQEESVRVQARRAKAEQELGQPLTGSGSIGLALSGGGIRSATFCLGVLRGLARKGILAKADFLSTVSGGGYAGSFLGALIQRDGLAGALSCLENDPPPVPGSAGQASKAAPSQAASPIRWLRNNGRYLAPSGSGDLLLIASILFRNWVAVQVVLGLFFLGVLLALKGVWALPIPASFLAWTAQPGSSLWLSPWGIVAGLLFLLAAVPPGWAYWLVEAQGEDRKSRLFSPVRVAVGSVLLFAGVGCIGLWAPSVREATRPLFGVSWVTWAGFAAALEGLQAVAWLALLERSFARASGLGQSAPFEPLPAQRAAWLRWRLSHLLNAGLMLTLLVLLFAGADTLGQSAYAIWSDQGRHGVALWAAGFASVAGALSVWGHKLATLLPERKKGVPLPVNLLAGVAAALLLVTLLVGYAALATGLAWGFKPVGWPLQTAQPTGSVGALLLQPSAPVQARPAASPARLPEAAVPPPAITAPGAPFARRVWLGALLVAAAMSIFAFGRNLAFLNLSAMSAFYQQRLTRTFLGASNPERRARTTSPRDHAPGDDLPFESYQPWQQGGPLHFVNVTINETLDGSTQIQNQDRKGLILAAGPVGLSVGVRHHALWAQGDPCLLQPEVGSRWPVFFSSQGEALAPQPLTLGQWVGISGAAVSTGMGARTSFGLSFLCGFFNLRTGYWWQSGVDSAKRTDRAAGQSGLWHRFSRALPVHAHLLDEWMARFQGTVRRYWYLSDGGHFENSGVYELARRRVPFIILCDAGGDADYVFDDLGNLTLKLRNDFGAELRFLAAPELAGAWLEIEQGLGLPTGLGVGAGLGPLDALRRGDWVQGEGGAVLAKAATEGLSRAHAALAKITYPCGPDGQPAHSFLLVLKPALVGDEPMDIRYYHATHPDFPHESTADQFFDEAQWEAYRKLGEHSVDAVFQGHTA